MLVQSLSYVQLFATLWAVAHQAPLSMGILQARILEWVAMPTTGNLPNPGIEPRFPSLQSDSSPSELLLSRFSHVQLCATPETAAHQAPPSLGFSRQEHWSGLPFHNSIHMDNSVPFVYQMNPTPSHPPTTLSNHLSSCCYRFSYSKFSQEWNHNGMWSL